LTKPEIVITSATSSHATSVSQICEHRKRSETGSNIRLIATPSDPEPERNGDREQATEAAARHEIVLRAVERFALLLAEAGMPRMPARVLAYVLIDEANGYTAGELATNLRVSPAAISGAVRYLIQAGMLARERQPGARSDHYQLHNDIWYEAYVQRIDVMRRWEDLLSETIELIGPDRASASLLDTRDFLAFLQAEYPEIMDRWRERRRSLTRDDPAARPD
jgi:DNA-binding transcriptional regulator GbsR (MarR family)